MSGLRETPREQEAARWFAALRRGVMSLEERSAFEAWRGDAANARAIADLERIWGALGVLQGQFAGASSVPSAPAMRAKVARSAVLAVFAVSLGIGILSYSGPDRFWTTLDWTAR
jgi:transmembrane sensor